MILEVEDQQMILGVEFEGKTFYVWISVNNQLTQQQRAVVPCLGKP
jgi:hypothetical protein